MKARLSAGVVAHRDGNAEPRERADDPMIDPSTTPGAHSTEARGFASTAAFSRTGRAESVARSEPVFVAPGSRVIPVARIRRGGGLDARAGRGPQPAERGPGLLAGTDEIDEHVSSRRPPRSSAIGPSR